MKYTALFSAILLFSPFVHAITDMKPTLIIQAQILPDSTYLFTAKEIGRTKNTSLIEVKDQSLGNPKLHMAPVANAFLRICTFLRFAKERRFTKFTLLNENNVNYKYLIGFTDNSSENEAKKEFSDQKDIDQAKFHLFSLDDKETTEICAYNINKNMVVLNGSN